MGINPTVTVIIPTYNRAHLIARAIQSVLKQTYQDFELIIVDDASTDKTEEVVKTFNDERLKYIRLRENSGSSAAPTNAGITIAKGEYVAVLDSDDEWLPGKLEKQMKVFRECAPEVGIVYTDMWRISGDGEKAYWHSPRIMPEDGIIYRDALSYRVVNIGTQTLVIKKQCFSKAGLFDEKLPHYIDTELLMRISKHYYFYHIDEPLVNWYATPGSISSSLKSAILARKLILQKYFKEIKNDSRLLAKHYADIGKCLCVNGELQEGRNYLLKAFVEYPFNNIRILLIAFLSLFGWGIYSKVLEIYARIKGWLFGAI